MEIELHPFLLEFKMEHARILAGLSALMARGDWPQFFRYATENVLNGVEKREELYLFAAIAAKAEIRSGGPMCMLYFDLHTSSPPLLQAATMCDEPVQNPRAAPPPHRVPFYESGSPVCIPIEDHLALEQISRHAEKAAGDTHRLSILGTVYFQILKLHFEKEDNCLLAMSQSLLSNEELDLWWKKSRV
jgi:hypothetical protein